MKLQELVLEYYDKDGYHLVSRVEDQSGDVFLTLTSDDRRHFITNNRTMADLVYPSDVDLMNCTLDMGSCNLKSLKGCPEKVSWIDVQHNKINTLEGFPAEAQVIWAEYNSLPDLKNVHKIIKKAEELHFENNPIKSHVLGLLLIDGLTDISLSYKEVQRVIQKYLKLKIDPKQKVVEAQNELQDLGYDNFAQL